MQTYTTIVGVIEIRMQKVGYATTQKRYGIGSSTVTLIRVRVFLQYLRKKQVISTVCGHDGGNVYYTNEYGTGQNGAK